MVIYQNKKKMYIYTLFFILFIIIIYIIIKYLKFIFFPLSISLLLSYILGPIVSFIDKYTSNRTLSVIILFSVFFILILLLILFVIPKIYKDVYEFFIILPEYIERYKKIAEKIQNYLGNSNMPQILRDMIDTNIKMIGDILFDYVQNFNKSILNIFSHIFDMIIIPILTFYFLKDSEYFTNKIMGTLPVKYKKSTSVIINDINTVFGKFVRGQLIIALIVALLSTIGLYFIKVRYALLLGIISGLFNIIPYFGPVIGSIPAVILAALDSPGKVFSVIIVFFVIQQFESGIISPKIIGDSMELHPVIVIISLLVAGKFFGMIGMLIVVPIVAILRVLLNHIYNALV